MTRIAVMVMVFFVAFGLWACDPEDDDDDDDDAGSSEDMSEFNSATCEQWERCWEEDFDAEFQLQGACRDYLDSLAENSATMRCYEICDPDDNCSAYSGCIDACAY